MIQTSEKEQKFLSHVKKEVEWRKHHQHYVLIEQYNTTLRKFNIVQQHMEHMMQVKENLQWIEESEKLRPFLENISWSEVVSDVEKSAFVEEQDAKIFRCISLLE